MFHPAVLLLAWAASAVLVPLAPPLVGALLAVAALVVARARATERIVRLLRRARWLLLSLFLLFAFATPGLRLDGLPGALGITEDGLRGAVEHVARLVFLLATLALLHEHLGTRGFMSGLHWLLRPLVAGGLRDRIVVRLMLVVEFVESGTPGGWRHWLDGAAAGPAELTLETLPALRHDWLALAALGILLTAAMAW